MGQATTELLRIQSCSSKIELGQCSWRKFEALSSLSVWYFHISSRSPKLEKVLVDRAMTSGTGLGIAELLSEKRAEILSIAEKHGVFNVRLLGSVARGEATEQSDVDFWVDYSIDRIMLRRISRWCAMLRSTCSTRRPLRS